MIIFGAFFIAVLATIGLLVFKRSAVTWWEIGLVLIVPLMCITISKAIVETVATSDTEFWGGYIIAGRHEEKWNEYIRKTCTRQNCSGSGESRKCSTETYDCSYVRTHPPRWRVWNNVGEVFDITPQHWNYLIYKFGVNDWVNMKRKYHTINGNAFDTRWQGAPETIEPTVTEHTYENRIIASTSIYKPREVNPKIYGVVPYPQVIKPYYQQVILGDLTGLSDLKLREEQFQQINGLLGKEKQIKIFIVVFNNKPMEAAFSQRDYWMSGNKNEFVIVIGRSGEDIQWVYPFSWQDNKQLDVDTRNFILDQKKFNPDMLYNLATWIQPQIRQNWKRKEFKDFSYLTVEPSLTAILVTYLITLLLIVGVSAWAIFNDFKNRSVEDIQFAQGYNTSKNWLKNKLTNCYRRCYNFINKRKVNE